MFVEPGSVSTGGVVLAGALCRLRPYRLNDVEALRATADDPLVSRWMTATFPNPYTRTDARAWVARVVADPVPQHFVVEVGGVFAGAAGVMALQGEHRGVATFGYWLGRAFWGRGIATDAARTLARYGLGACGYRRLEAMVFAPNTVSARVLEKCGFTLEARMRDTYVQRDGAICDGLLYARLSWDPEPPPNSPQLVAPRRDAPT
jgi:[ribosomal protein S5]-alanine N-acetyltransferase